MIADAPLSSSNRAWMRFVIGKSPRFTLVRIIVLVGLTTFLFSKVLVPIRVMGISMDPSYPDGRVNLVNRLSYRHHKPNRFDVVALRKPGEKILLLKRIIGLPGERVAIENGFFKINGKIIEEPHVKLKSRSWNEEETVLGPDEFYYMGDNRSMDIGQHEHGVAQQDWIVGKVLF